MNLLKSILAALALITAMSAHANEPWDKTDKALFAGLTAVRIVDMAQTLQIARRPYSAGPGLRYEETNPFIGRNPSSAYVVSYFAASHALAYLITDYLSPKTRKAFLTGAVVFSASYVKNNVSIGLTGSF
jgi:hypothetical protein